MNALQQLLTHIDRLRSMHKAGIVAQGGDLEQLWDFVQDVRGDLANGHIVVQVPTANAGAPGAPPTSRVSVRFVAEIVDGATGYVTFREPLSLTAESGRS